MCHKLYTTKKQGFVWWVCWRTGGTMITGGHRNSCCIVVASSRKAQHVFHLECTLLLWTSYPRCFTFQGGSRSFHFWRSRSFKLFFIKINTTPVKLYYVYIKSNINKIQLLWNNLKRFYLFRNYWNRGFLSISC